MSRTYDALKNAEVERRPATDSVGRRLDLLERDNRRLKWVGTFVLVGITAAVVVAQVRPGEVVKVVEAEQFIVRDKSGQTRATIAFGTVKDGKGQVELKLLDGTLGLLSYDGNEKKGTALIGGDEAPLSRRDGPLLYFSDERGENQVMCLP